MVPMACQPVCAPRPNATVLLDEVDRYRGAPSQDTLRRSAELRLPSPRDRVAIHLFRSQRVAAIGSRSQIGRRRHPDPPRFAARLRRGGNRCRPDDTPTPADVCPGRRWTDRGLDGWSNGRARPRHAVLRLPPTGGNGCPYAVQLLKVDRLCSVVDGTAAVDPRPTLHKVRWRTAS